MDRGVPLGRPRDVLAESSRRLRLHTLHGDTCCGQQYVPGYIECKRPDEGNLDHDEVSEQLKYYCCPSTTNNVARFEGSTSEIPVTCSQTPYYTSAAASTCNAAHPSEGAGCFFRRPFFFLTYHSELGVQCRAWSHSTMASSNRPSFSRSMIALV